jgi:AmpE protein
VAGDRWFIDGIGIAGRFTHRLGLPEWFEPLLLIGLPCLVIAQLQYWVDTALFGLPTLVLMVLVLFYSTGRGDFRAAVDSYLEHWQSGDMQTAYRLAQEFSHSASVGESSDYAQLHRHSVEAVLYHIFERWFCVVFWFAAVGPWAALGYRLARLYIERRGEIANANSELTARFIYMVEWLPVRILAFSFALAGNFPSCFKAWREQITSSGYSAPELLRICGIAALGEREVLACQQPCSREQAAAIVQGAEQIKGLQSLVQRTAVVWLLAMALIILVLE